MLDKAKLTAFVVTTDAARARRFFGDVLGLRIEGEDDFALVVDANGTKIRVTKMKEWTPLQHTVVGWEVTDIEGSVRGLVERGVAFEKYGFLEQDALGIWKAPGGTARVAWFKDPDGNVLSLQQA